jgi:hypothetical protein
MCHFNQGKYKDVAFVFSCPGKEEQENNRPVSGITGRNLEFFISELYKGKDRNNATRYDFRITNSVSEVFYKGLNGRTEPKASDIKNQSNIDRLYNEIKDVKKIIICFGRKAERAVSLVRKKYEFINIEVIYIPHLGLQSLNRLKIKNELKGEKSIQFKIKSLIREKQLKQKL